jgi:S-disulfanyl-L-cysteine oxidoreductase SoxD
MYMPRPIVCFAAVVMLSAAARAQNGYPLRLDIGAIPSAQELAQFLSINPDGRGLPPGRGSAAAGQKVYADYCAACHGDKLQGIPTAGIGGDKLIGGRGTLASEAPVKTVESYWPYATTLFDYIYRAMPLNAPGSLTYDQVYAVSAYILSQAKIIPADAVINQDNLAKVSMPNRDGFVPDHRPEKFPPPSATPHQDLKLGQTPP